MQWDAAFGGLPDEVVACVGGGSNALGIFDAFIDAPVGPPRPASRPAAPGPALGSHAARFAGGAPGIFQGTHTAVLQHDDGNIAGTHSVSAGLDYAAIGPEHAWLREIGRAQYTHVSDDEALEAFSTLGPAGGHPAGARVGARHRVRVPPRARDSGRAASILVNLSGRGDKDVQSVAARLRVETE